MDKEPQIILRFGQIVRLHGNYTDEKKGLLLAKGFTDNNTYFMTYDIFPQINNYRDSLFQILPRGAFDIHDEYIKSNQAQRELIAPRMRTEADQYNIIIQNRMNEEIIFGSEVIFKHIDSDEYLFGSYQCSDFSTDAFKVQLVSLLSSLTVFQLQPYQTFQQEGHRIYINEPLVIQHQKSQCKLDFIRTRRVLIDQQIEYTIEGSDLGLDADSYEKFRPCIRKPSKNNMRYEAVVNHNQKSNWVLKLHESYDESKDRLQRVEPYDLVMFQYTQNKSFLSVDTESFQLILKEAKNEENQISLDAVWELQPIISNNEIRLPEFVTRPRNTTNAVQDHMVRFGRNSIISAPGHFNHQEKSKSGKTKYVIRHFLSGKVITFPETKNQVIVGEFDGRDQQMLEVQMAKKGLEEMVQNTYVKICFNKQELQKFTAVQKVNVNKPGFKRKSSFSSMEMFFKTLNEDDLDYRKQNVCFTDDDTLHAFQLLKLDEQYKKDLLLIISTQEILLQFADILKLPVKIVEKTLNDKILANVQDVLRAILAYVMNIKEKNLAEKSEAIPLKMRQIFLKDLRMIEVVMEIIFFISYKNGVETLFKRWRSERDKLKNIYKLSFKFIEKLTKRNPQIKLHVSQWLELFLHQAMNIDDLQVQNSLSELLDDNYQAITKFISKTSLRRLVDILKQRIPHEKYLRILSSISICNGKSIINNQIYTLTMFFQQIQPEFRFQFMKENDIVLVQCHIGKKDVKWRSLKQFYEDSEISDDLQSWNYFISYFNLLADVNMNRNKFAKKYVEDNFSLDILCSVLEDPDCLDTNSIEPFLKLIHFAYVDCQHYTPIRQIARVREWHTIETKNDIIRTHAEAPLKPENCDLKRVMKFIENFLNDFDYFEVSQRNDNQNLYTILQVLKTTIKLGFWKSVTNLQSILPNLIKICSCSKDFQKYRDQNDIQVSKLQYNQQSDDKEHYKKSKSQLTRMNLENLIVMKCKMLSCEIMDIILDMETNVRVSKATQILKKMIHESEKKDPIQQSEVNLKKSSSAISQNVEIESGVPQKQPNTLSALQESQQKKRRTSLLYQLLDPVAIDEPVLNPVLSESTQFNQIKNLNIFKKLGNLFRKNQETNKDQQLYDVDIWIEHMRSLIDDRSLFGEVPKDKYFIEVLIAELSLFDNPQMLQFALSLLNRIYGQRRELLLNFEKIIIVFQGSTFTLSVESRVTRTKLLALNDRNILSATLDNQKDFNVYIWRESENAKETGIIQDLNYLVQCQKRGEVKRSMIKIDYQDIYPTNGLNAIFTEKEVTHKLHQSLLKWQDLHESVFSFLYIAQEINPDNTLLMKCLHICYNYLTMLVWNHLDNKIDFYQSYQIQKLFVHTQYNIGCIDFLRELFTNNKSLLYNERLIQDVTTCVIQYCNQLSLDKYYKSKLLDFLRALVVFNNKPIKNNQITIMSKLQEYNSNIMFLLKTEDSQYDFHDCQEQSVQIKQQQQKQKKMVQRPSIPKGNLWNEQAFQFWIDEYQIEYETCFQTKELNIPSELCYMFTYFQVFSCLIEDRNEINIGKCMNMHPYYKLLQIYPMTLNCWPLKRYLRAYINRLYYVQNDYEEMSQIIIEYDFDNIINDLQDLIDLKIQFGVQQIDKIKLKNPVRYSYLSSYLYLCLEEILISLNSFLDNQKFLDDLDEHLTLNFNQQKLKTHLQLLQIGGQLAQIKKLWNYCQFISQFSKILIMTFKSVFQTFDLSLLVVRESLYLSALQMHIVTEVIKIERVTIENGGVEQRSKHLIHEQSTDPAKILNSEIKILVDSQSSFDKSKSMQEYLLDPSHVDALKIILADKVFTQAEEYLKILTVNSISKEEKVQQSLKRMFNIKNAEDHKEDINESLNKKHRRLMSTLIVNPKFQRFMEDEFIQVCLKLNQIDYESQRIYGTTFPVITLEEFITNIIYLNINNPQCLKDDLKVFFLKVLTRIITEKNENNKLAQEPIDQWNPEYWSDYKKQIKQAQLLLNKCGAAELICQLLKESNLGQRVTLTNELLIFGVAFLLGGSSECQNSILTRMKADQHNSMLQNYTLMIRKIGKVIYNNLKIKKEQSDNKPLFQVIYTDNYDFYDEKMDMMQRYHQVETDDAKEIAFQKQCLDIMCISFRFLQLLCENNNVEMKNFIRLQTDNDGNIKLNSINFIEFTTSQLRIFFKIMNKYITSIPNFMLDFLTEVTQLPCLENQLTLCKTTFFEDSCYMSQYFSNQENQLTRKFDEPGDIKNLQELYNKIIMAAMSVLEGNDERIYEEIQNKLEPRFLIENITQNLEALEVENVYDMRRLLKLQGGIFSERLVKILNVLVIFQKVNIRCGEGNNQNKSKWIEDLKSKIANNSNLKAIIDILNTKIKHIEIVYQENKQLIFFPSHPLFDFLSEQTKDKIMFSINRETQREKVLGLLQMQDTIFNEIEYNHQLNQMIIPVTNKTIDLLKQIAATLSILVNVFMVLFYNVEVYNKTSTLSASFYLEVILTMLQLLQFTFSTALFTVILRNRIPLVLIMQNIELDKKNKSVLQDSSDLINIIASDELDQKDDDQLANYQELFYEIFKQFRIDGIKRTLIESAYLLISRFTVSRFIPFTIKMKQNLQKLLQNIYHLALYEEDFSQYFIYWVFSFLGAFVQNYFFSLHLFDLFSRLTLLKNVFQAISYNAKQLLFVAMLGVLFIFVFSFISFNTYVDEIYLEVQPEESCSTLIQCMITLSTSGVIGGSMSNWDPLKFFFDTLYFIFFGLLFANIISGIMIDTFAELRDQREKIEDDKKNCCFICGIDKQALEKSNEFFEEHIREKHNLWNYLFYIYGLLKKDSTEYTGLEYAIHDMLQKEDISWFPMISTDNISMIENFDSMLKKMDLLKEELQERNIQCIETVKALLVEKTQEQDKDKKKQ